MNVMAKSGWVMNGKICMEGKLHPGNELAIARTVLANERTLMAILRTAPGSFIGGAGLFKFFGHLAYETELWNVFKWAVMANKKHGRD
jgi:uncharacterized membrane protein YidH (DUF202 family)